MSNDGFSISGEIDDKLKEISPNVDLRQGPPISQKRTITFVNHFVMQMVDFLNKFAQSCESRLFLCDQKMRKLEDELLLLEAKLNSVPGVGTVEMPNSTHVQSPDVSASSIPTPDTKELNSVTPSPSMEENVAVTTSNGNESVTTSNENECIDISKYTKMVQFGVPPQAVKLKMQQEGFDPHLLDCKET